ncbi:leucine--tRNA ligase [Corynebacterium pseudodiphtheriticum]|uniref:leucine--tRNA ligase n=1 Tax=Corynebacterium pseudodiphtheriticum TaxID=37637 RepID=UPI002543C4A6|nr:leucine--tRNA ligase [Corynebacterium pseudodiphtheriticum]MDK4206892.1 leucine--tRNA ligase [Corynebacterium pseudodiphtheriticum]MDK4243596.1 leucine--tRNA ligase [Corynebacterium pseudodiphtheriticum]MDK4277867.1 leucine--tRNA ligase [Corynebacterium pseudodiphtheriticum]MDK4296450.1 leucine--tRNA ligase [Corynebacterium pseudodiphtheriticum]
MTEARENTENLSAENVSNTGPEHRYTPQLANQIESRWQQYWDDNGTFHAPNPTGDLALADGTLPEDKLFVQDMFPYPSGAGLHVGHPLGYIATDVFARFNRLLGKNVLHTLGYDAFGLPAEQYAIQTGTHPRTTTVANIANMRRQLGSLGLGHDKRRSVATIDPEFYRWTQWIFLQIYQSWFDEQQQKARPIDELYPLLESGELATKDGREYASLSEEEKDRAVDEFRLVYLSDSTVNWCPGLGTVLANEEVTADGRSERGNFPVFRKNLKQWMMRITAYSDRLLDDLELLDWPEKVKSMQRNWIGRSRGAEVDFRCEGHDITVFTTRPDTLFGAEYVVLAPEHPLVDALLSPVPYDDDVDARWTYGHEDPKEAIEAYRSDIAAKSDLERQENKEKTGVFLGSYATNPVNGKKLPVFTADYVLTGYGTGAIMAVPAHDERDYEYAQVFGLPITEVVAGGDISSAAHTGEGTYVNSANDDGLDLTGKSKAEAIATTIDWLAARELGVEKIQYKLRDWLFARQRYWGEPFPIVYDEAGRPHAIPEDQLPVELPEVDDYQPVSFDPDDHDTEPQPPLAKAREWIEVEMDLGEGTKTYYRDANVMPQWAGSSWYQMRYIDPTNSEAFCDIDNERYWTGPRPEVHGPNDPGGVDLYVGGVEHAVLHLLYARFWHKVLYDLGHVSSKEPYRRLYNQGYIQAYAYTDSRGVYVPAEEVEERDGEFFYHGDKVNREYGKMGKSLKNAVAPDDIAENFGADTLRVYEMSMGPLADSRPWATKDVVGAQRFLQRLWRLVVNENTGEVAVVDAELGKKDLQQLHRTIAGVRDDYENLRVNTVVAKLIEYVNYLTKNYPDGAPRAGVEPIAVMVAPVAPHIAEELWTRLGHEGTITFVSFPSFDEKYLVDDEIELPVQVNGKVKSRVQVAADVSQDDAVAAALADDKVLAAIGEKSVVKKIVVPGRMINLVVK